MASPDPDPAKATATCLLVLFPCEAVMRLTRRAEWPAQRPQHLRLRRRLARVPEGCRLLVHRECRWLQHLLPAAAQRASQHPQWHLHLQQALAAVPVPQPLLAPACLMVDQALSVCQPRLPCAQYPRGRQPRRLQRFQRLRLHS